MTLGILSIYEPLFWSWLLMFWRTWPLRPNTNAFWNFFLHVWLTRYRSTPSTPHNVGRSSRRTEPRTAVSSSSAAAATTKTTKRKGGLLAKMKSLGGLKKGASRTGGGATRSSTRTTRSSRSGGIGAGASRTGGGRWNWGLCCVVLEGAGDCIILDRYKADWTKWTKQFLKIKNVPG